MKRKTPTKLHVYKKMDQMDECGSLELRALATPHFTISHDLNFESWSSGVTRRTEPLVVTHFTFNISLIDKTWFALVCLRLVPTNGPTTFASYSNQIQLVMHILNQTLLIPGSQSTMTVSISTHHWSDMTFTSAALPTLIVLLSASFIWRLARYLYTRTAPSLRKYERPIT